MSRIHQLAHVSALILTLAAPISSADSGATLLQLRHDFGGRSVTRIELRLVANDQEASAYTAPALPILSSNANEISIMNLDQGKDSSDFCDRHRTGCLFIIGTVLWGAVLYSAEKAHTKELPNGLFARSP